MSVTVCRAQGTSYHFKYRTFLESLHSGVVCREGGKILLPGGCTVQWLRAAVTTPKSRSAARYQELKAAAWCCPFTWDLLHLFGTSITSPSFFRGSETGWFWSRVLARTFISCRSILGGGSRLPAQSGKQRPQHPRFVPQVAKLVENVEEETPRTLLKGICAQEDPLDLAVNRTRCNSTSVAEAAAAAAAAAAASTAAAVAGSAKAIRERAEGGRAGVGCATLPQPTVSFC